MGKVHHAYDNRQYYIICLVLQFKYSLHSLMFMVYHVYSIVIMYPLYCSIIDIFEVDMMIYLPVVRSTVFTKPCMAM